MSDDSYKKRKREEEKRRHEAEKKAEESRRRWKAIMEVVERLVIKHNRNVWSNTKLLLNTIGREIVDLRRDGFYLDRSGKRMNAIYIESKDIDKREPNQSMRVDMMDQFITMYYYSTYKSTIVVREIRRTNLLEIQVAGYGMIHKDSSVDWLPGMQTRSIYTLKTLPTFTTSGREPHHYTNDPNEAAQVLYKMAAEQSEMVARYKREVDATIKRRVLGLLLLFISLIIALAW